MVMATGPFRTRIHCGILDRTRAMEDVIWILVMLGLVAATLAYARLCDNA